MGRKKGNPTKPLNFRIDVDIADRLKELAQFENLTQSAFMELMILRWDEGINPETKLNSLLNERREANNILNVVDGKIKEASDQVTFFNDMKRQKIRRKPEALEIIVKHLKNQDLQAAERISRFWQRETGISSLELLMEARDQIAEQQRKISLNH